MDLPDLGQKLRTLADPARLRIAYLTSQQELTVTELTAILNLSQPRVSAHLARLLDDGLVSTRREGRFVYYALATESAPARSAFAPALLDLVEGTTEAANDRAALAEILARRNDAVPPESLGHEYLPGRTWEGLAKALLALLPPLRIADLGIGSGELTLLLAESSAKLIAVDCDAEALARFAAKAEAAGLRDRPETRLGDLEDPPIARGEVDLWVLSQVLHAIDDPARALAAAAARLPAGGRVLVLDLLAHSERWVETRLGHRRLGFTEAGLLRLLESAGFQDLRVRRVARDRKPPHFVSILGIGRKP